MKVKSEANFKSEEKGPRSYPWLGKYETHSDSYFIVLFHRARCGSVVYSHNHVFSVSHYNDSWTMNAYTPFYGEIKLTSTP